MKHLTEYQREEIMNELAPQLNELGQDLQSRHRQFGKIETLTPTALAMIAGAMLSNDKDTNPLTDFDITEVDSLVFLEEWEQELREVAAFALIDFIVNRLQEGDSSK